MHIDSSHARSAAAIRPVIAAVTPSDLDLPTPCTGWDLRALLAHVTGQDHGFAAAVRAARPPDPPEGTDPPEGAAGPAVPGAGAAGSAPVPVEAFAPRAVDEARIAADHGAGLDAVVAAFAAARPDDLVHLAEFDATLPVRVAEDMHLLDTLVHGWDVAATLGRPVTYDDDLVEACLAVARQIPPGASRTVPDAPFAPIPPGDRATPWEQALALCGRDPAWAPTGARA